MPYEEDEWGDETDIAQEIAHGYEQRGLTQPRAAEQANSFMSRYADHVSAWRAWQQELDDPADSPEQVAADFAAQQRAADADLTSITDRIMREPEWVEPVDQWAADEISDAENTRRLAENEHIRAESGFDLDPLPQTVVRRGQRVGRDDVLLDRGPRDGDTTSSQALDPEAAERIARAAVYDPAPDSQNRLEQRVEIQVQEQQLAQAQAAAQIVQERTMTLDGDDSYGYRPAAPAQQSIGPSR